VLASPEIGEFPSPIDHSLGKIGENPVRAQAAEAGDFAGGIHGVRQRRAGPAGAHPCTKRAVTKRAAGFTAVARTRRALKA